MSKLNTSVYLILHNVRSCYNVGSIFRTADAAGIDKIYLCGYTPAPEAQISNFQFFPIRKANRGSSIPQSGIGTISKQITNPKFQIQKRDKISKTALGAEKYVPWEKCKQTWRLLEKLGSEGVKIIALERFDRLTAGKLGVKNIFNYKPPKNKSIALVVGHERKGLSKKILEYVDDIVEIPMRGRKESLNVSVAVGIALYEISRKME